MPIFEYRCRDCSSKFEAIVSGSRPASCPKCSGQALDKLLSVFAVGGPSDNASASAAPFAGGGCGSCGDPRGPGACSLD